MLKPKPLEEYRIKPLALFQLRRRQISDAALRQLLQSPDQIIEDRNGRYIYQSRIRFTDSGKEYLIRVVVDLTSDPAEVVTAYRTSNIKKYWR
jgi:hypothetical protein